MLDNADISIRAKNREDQTTREFYHHSSAQRTFTQALIAESLAKQYPDLPITTIPRSDGYGGLGCDLLAYAALGHAKFIPIIESQTSPLTTRSYIMPARRMDAGQGFMIEDTIYAKYWYSYKGEDYLLYLISGRDGTAAPFSPTRSDLQYLIGPKQHVADELIKGATEYQSQLHNEIWVFDSGYWQKSADLYQSIEKASWDDVILDPEMKADIQNDVLRFFASQDRYEKLRVPWKRGIIYYGPPGNGKTVSIKATMHTLYHMKDPIPSLYVRSLASFGGPEYSIKEIFAKARQEAPCLLIFEDLDSLVRDDSRTYFLNEVDGLQVNDGVLMIGSTNHLDRLDPGIAKRPSRFDRKWEFPKPNETERVLYCEYWRGKLSDNDDIEFPEKMCKAIAHITKDFSFAYMQEAFVASLLEIANGERKDQSRVDQNFDKWMNEQERCTVSDLECLAGEHRKIEMRDDLEKYVLWRVIQKQIKILRQEL